MTSISQPVLPPQAPSNASQVAPAHSPSASVSGKAPPQAAGTASATAKTSYASATKKTFPQPFASGTPIPSASAVQVPAQHGKPDTSSPVNGRVAIPPAVPTVGASAVVNGNTPTSSNSGAGDHSRKPPVIINATGASGYLPNGGPVAGKPIGGSSIQFGSHPTDASPALQNATPQFSQATNSLTVNNPLNPRVTSPQTSPSPIPQPPASGGGLPSSFHGNSPSFNFGSFGGAEPNQMRPPGAPQGPLAPGPQPSHFRRESSQSQHSDMSNHAIPSASRGGYPSQGSRGRGGYQNQYPQSSMGYVPGSNTRPPPSQPRGNQNPTPYQGQNRTLIPPFPSSPLQGTRSPALANSQPAHPQPGQIPMPSPQMSGQHPYGYHSQYGPYPPNMGPPQVNPQSSSSAERNFPRQQHSGSDQRRDSNKNAVPVPYLSYDISPASGKFEQFLTLREQQGQNYYDPTYGYYNMYGVPGMPQQPMAPSSPRPPHQMTPGPQQPQYHTGQFNNQQQPSPMSRTSSAISHSDRPSSSMGRPQGSSTPAINNAAAANRHANSPAPKPTNTFQIPPKKKTGGIVIKNPNSGDVVTFDKSSASPALSSKSPAVAPTLTPPPRAPSHTDHQQARTENKNVKTDDEKRKEMRETIAKKMEADRVEEQRKKDEEESKAAQEQLDSEDKLVKEKEEADAKQREAAAAHIKAEEALRKENAAAEEAKKIAAKAKEEADEAAEKARKEQEQEDEITRMEAEYAEMERKEKENEERYAAKKKAEKEEAALKEAEAFKMADEEMKRAEREAEEAEEARLKELESSEGEGSQKERVDMFLQLKRDGSATPTSEAPATAEEAPVDSGIATPASDAPAPATSSKPANTGGKQKPTALKLDTVKSVEPAQPSAQLLSLRSARRLTSINDVSYPAPINSPNPALNEGAPMGKLRYNKEFLLQFQRAFVEKPSENWTERVKETVGDTSEPSSARTPARGGGGGGAGSMMTGRQPSNRAPLPQMGAFAQGGRTLPPNTTSSQRFEAANANRNAQSARPTMQNPLASFVSRPGSGFPTAATSTKMDRTPSSTSLNHPNSPRNASQRGGSQRGSRAATRREDPKDNKAMPLTAGANLKPIEVTASGWKPTSVGPNATGMAGPAPGGNGHLAPDVVQRKVKSNLNKMTPNNFDKITIQILDISSQSKDESDGRTLRQVIQLTFEKATDEAHWAEMYAQFCKRMLESMSPEIKDENVLHKGAVVHGGALFRKYLLNRCQEEFERGWKLDLGDKPEGETEEAKMLSDEYYKEAAAKRRGLGLVRFIGELYKLGMLTERIMHECVKKLVDYDGMPDEAEVESLTNLLRTIGQPLDSTNNGPKMMDAYFMKINEMMKIEGLPSRLRFMLMDIVDLRKKNWHSKGGALKGPTTLEEVRAQAVQQEREKELQRQQDSSRRGGAGGGRPPIGRGDARNFSGGGGQYGMMPPPDFHKNTVGMDDLRRLGSKGGSRQVSSQGQPTFGPTSMFGGPRGSNTRRPGMAGTQKDDSGASSRTGTPPAQKEKREKEEKEAAKSVNTFSALAGLESSEAADQASSPSTSPPTANAQPVERQRANSPKSQGSGERGKDAETS